ncbi:MAG: hypothetical protein HY778_08175 [Betaproteobacteria bacterium]|nr:hypothetical protein [Betaproteobacteria bacterium]
MKLLARYAPPPTRQRGAALVIALLFLVVLTLLGLSSASTGTYEERMARYTRDRNTALQAAEAALRDARKEALLEQTTRPEVWTQSAGASAPDDCGSATPYAGKCTYATSGSFNAFRTDHGLTGIASLLDSRGVAYGTYTYASGNTGPATVSLPGVARQPQYVVEPVTAVMAGDSVKFGNAFKNPRYRITARGFGASAQTQVIVQEMVSR